MTSPTIGFVGLSHLGIISAVAAAEKGFPVIAYDTSAELVAQLAAGHPPITEPDLPEALARNAARLRFTSTSADLAACDVVILSRDVPTDEAGISDIAPVEALFQEMVASSRPDAVLVVLCQVAPGFTRAHGMAGRVLHYQVETLVFGQAVERALKPERFIVGCDDPSQSLPAAYAAYLGAFGCPILPMRHESAELAKIAINCCLVAMVSTANTLAELCEAIGADWSEIVPALRSDRRIGPYSYLVPGLGIAGGNLERDLTTVVNMAKTHGTDAGVVSSWIENSRHRKDWPAAVLRRQLGERMASARIGMLGLAYKIDTASIKNSPAVHLIESFPGTCFQAHDPAVAPDGVPQVIRAADPLEACRGADAVAVMTPWAAYKSIAPADIAAVMAGRLLVDPFGVFPSAAVMAAGLDHFTLGSPAVKTA